MGDKSWYAMLRKSHLCVECKQADENTLAGRSRCRKCSENRKKYWLSRKAVMDEWQASHRCTKCGAELGEDTHKTCAKCRDWKRQYMRQYNLKSKQAQKPKPEFTLWELRERNGECVKCGKAPTYKGTLVCEACYRRICKMVARRVEARKRK